MPLPCRPKPSLAGFFGPDLVPELQALTARAPLDLRVNSLKVASRGEAHDMLPHLGAVETPISPSGLRIQPGEDGRGPAVQSEPEFIKGWIEIQDEGSQIAALLRPLPFSDPDRLVMIHVLRTTPQDGLLRLRWSMPSAPPPPCCPCPNEMCTLSRARTSRAANCSGVRRFVVISSTAGLDRIRSVPCRPWFSSIRK